ncbi:hypothetical protein CFSAN000560_21535 [Salmonella enterica subsp. arizonae str. CFSAN000560]|nr:hypothetical protein [Salmonella enterica subsp. arizonae serovar 62:z36:-]ECG1414255.1 hypothetical protein [Salmonella enterica subsp. arizonae str. CFSAN000560]EGN8793964.1 hypothetical protein [Salmonella enterica]KSB67491.1 hypothetical protein LFZ49_22120 [Salmonella enterica subsp. arizonae serovar 62:z36:- str. 5335/86]EIX5949489.1 hypothetical protein [Salmonella enterica]
MTTITRERLLKIQQWRETYGTGSNVMLPAEEAEELARIALASLEAEPIGAFHIEDQQVSGTTDYIKDGEWPIDNGVIDVYAVPPASVVPEGLVKAVRFYEQVKRENPPVETGAWKDAVDWVLKEACKAVSMLESSREHEVISQ